ncbi:oxygenase MpaB family protein [Kitasatospora acidiphila]|uniref:oxygenase MpaB family protein n=1 Tax=Kitasatospora acidiphila TaxID=2567942 RepID=UPI003C773E3C
MTTTPSSAPFPGRLVNFEAAKAEHGERAEHMVRMLAVGDPLADAVIAELDSLGKDGRRLLNQGLADGLDSLGDPPPAIAALLRRLETLPDWADPDALAAGDRIAHLVPPLWNTLAFSAGSLSHTYSSPSIARLLVQTGRLDTMASRRLAETGLWKISAILPGGLHRGAAGYLQTAQVRLLHARVRATALKHGWETERWGLPINQVDVARTWLDFTVVPYSFLAAVGFVLTDEEQRSLYEYWWHVAHLLGLDEGFFLGMRSHAEASALADLLDSTIEAPDHNSRVLNKALYDATADFLADAPRSTFTKESARDLLHAVARHFHGDAIADALGVPHSGAAAALPALAAGHAQARRYQSLVPGAAELERAANIQAYTAIAASVQGATAYQSNIV